jgi:hypothetical protein
MGSIICVQLSPTQGKQLCGYKHHPTMPIGYNDILSCQMPLVMLIEKPQATNAFIPTLPKQSCMCQK